jgi:hypothetical protein
MPESIKREIIKKWLMILTEYELVKKKESKHFTKCKDLYDAYSTSAKQVRKYYVKWIESGKDDNFLLPDKRGPIVGPHRPPKEMERNIIAASRKLGKSRYELALIFKPYYGELTPSPSGIYQIKKRYPLNKKQKEIIKRYEKSYPGEMGHMDCLYLSKETRKQLNLNNLDKGYLIGLEDDCTRLVYTEYIPDIKAITANFFLYRALSWFKQNTGVEFDSILTDNGAEFTTHLKRDRKSHIFEQSLEALGIKHKRTKPYHPQTNGKIEAFWKITRNSFLKNSFSGFDDFKERLGNYLNDYNLYRKHGGLDYLTPFEKFKIVTELLD